MAWANEGWGGISDLSTSGYINSETNSLAASIIPTPSSTWLNAVDTCISSLKSGGVWTNLDLFYGFAAPSVDACTWNWKNTAVGRLTAVGGLTYTANTCVNSDGTTGYFTSTFAMNSGVGTNGSAHFGYFTLNECTGDGISPFQTSNAGHFLGLQGTTDGSLVPLTICRLNTSTYWQPSSVYGSTVGHWVTQQNTTTALELFLDGTSLGTSPAQTSAADNGTLLLLKAADNSFTTRKISFVHYGTKLTAPQQLALSKALYTFLTTMDVRPKTGYIGSLSGPGNDAPYKRVALGDGSTFSIPVTTSNANYSGVIQGRAGSYPYGLIKVGDPNYLNLYRMETHPNDFASFDTNIVRRMMLTQIVNTIPFPSPIIDCSFSVFIESGSQWENATVGIVDGRETVSGGGAQCGPTNGLTAAGNWYTWLFVNSASNVNQPPGTVQIGAASPATSAACSQGAWHHVRNLWKFDTGSAGFCQAWFDGVKTLDYVGTTGRGSPGAPYFHQLSLYSQTSGAVASSTSAVWIANYELDVTGAQPFAGRLASPLPTPTLPVVSVTAPNAPTISVVRNVASQNTLFNTSSGGTTTCNHLAAFGASSNPGATVTLYRASSVQLGTATTDASGNWRCELSVLADGAHALTAKITASGVTGAASSAFNVTINPTFTNLPVAIGQNMTVDQTIRMDGRLFRAQSNQSGTANPNSCILLDTHTLDMTTIPTDDWNGTHRSELYDADASGGVVFSGDGVTTNICYEYQLPTGYPINNNFNGGSQNGWCTIGQIHDQSVGVQGFGQECGGELGNTSNGDAFVIGYIDSSHSRREPYVDTQNQVRGVWHRIDWQIVFNSASPTGVIKVWRNNIQIANVTGIQWGFTPPYYSKFGCYHGSTVNQTVRILYRNFQIRTT